MSELNSENKNPKKIAVMGSGAIGEKLVGKLQQEYPDAEIVLWNRKSARGAAVADDREQAEIIKRKHKEIHNEIVYTSDLDKALRDTDIVVVTGGVSRTPGQPRFDLAGDNLAFIDPIARKVKELSEHGHNEQTAYFIASNPIGFIDKRFQDVSGAKVDHVLGLGGELDVSRLEQSIKKKLKLSSYDDIKNAMVIGDHGGDMIPVLSNIEVFKNGNWQKLLDLPEVKTSDFAMAKEIIQETIKAGSKIIEGKGHSAHVAPAEGLLLMVSRYTDAVNGKDVTPLVASVLNEEKGVYSGRPVQFTKNGTYELVNMPSLSKEERVGLDKSLNNAQKDMEKFSKLCAVKDELYYSLKPNKMGSTTEIVYSAIEEANDSDKTKSSKDKRFDVTIKLNVPAIEPQKLANIENNLKSIMNLGDESNLFSNKNVIPPTVSFIANKKQKDFIKSLAAEIDVETIKLPAHPSEKIDSVASATQSNVIELSSVKH